ncbi:MAG: glycosyltransferase [Bacteroidetes bacterium]|nr:glycosyltransferase [Bacteroidota bacterium]
MKSILFHVNSFLAGGIEKVLIELLRAMDPRKFDIHLSIAYNFGEQEVLISEIPAYVQVHHLLNEAWLVQAQKKKKTGKISIVEKLFSELVLPPFRKRAQAKALQELLKTVDIVIDFDTTLGPFYKLFQNKRSAAYCHFSFGQNWNGNKRKLDKLAARLMNYNRVVMLCKEMQDETALLYPALAPKLVTIYNALDKARIQELAKEPIDQSQLHGRPYIVSVGRLHEAQKDFTTLVKAYIDAVQRFRIEEYLVLVGYGSARESLEQLAKDADLADRVIFTGFQTNPYKWIANSSLFLFSSKYEGLPTVLIEAMILDKPIIATACPTGVKELLMNGAAGILTPVGDKVAMANALNKLIKNERLQIEYSEARAAFLQHFEPKYMVARVESLLIENSQELQS